MEAPLCNRTDSCYTEALDRFQTEEWIWESYCFEYSTTNFFYRDFFASRSTALDDERYNCHMFHYLKIDQEYRNQKLKRIMLSSLLFCETTQVDNYMQTASINGVDLLSNVADHTSLRTGISFLPVMELVEMLCRLIRYHFYIWRKNVTKNKWERKQKMTNDWM